MQKPPLSAPPTPIISMKQICNHFWSIITPDGNQECLWCRAFKHTSMKTKQEIEEINAQRKDALKKLIEAQQIFAATGCSLGAEIILTAIQDLQDMAEY